MSLTRRGFLGGMGMLGAGLCLGLSPTGAVAAPARGALQPNVFVNIAPDGKVTIVCHRSEMGQGVRSSLPALFADEIGADLGKIRIEQGDADKAYGDQNTDGSSSVRKRYRELRMLGATARTMLVAVAARQWKVSPDSCTTYDDAVHHDGSKRRLAFAQLVAEAAKLPVPDAEHVKLKPASALRYIGKALPLVDGPDIVSGRAIFAADVRLPNMLVAIIARPPVPGGSVKRYDDKAALAVPGVRQVVAMPVLSLPFKFQPLGGVAVLADNTWAAMRGAAALVVEWNHGDNASYDSVAYHAELERTVGRPGKVVRELGDVDKALAGARLVEAVYHTPHLAHAPMEPPAAIAQVVGKRCEVWATVQDPQRAQAEVALALKLAPDQVKVHVTLLGGGFGRKSKPDFVVEAAWLAQVANRPVRVQWTREDDVRHDYYHSTAVQHLTAGLDRNGKVVAWRQRIAFPPIGSTFTGAKVGGEGDLQQGILDLPLDVPHQRFEIGEAKAHARIGWLRSVANIYHAFSVQTFCDELAHARALDPRDNLLELWGASRQLSLENLGIPKLPNYGHPLSEHSVDAGRLRHVLTRATTLARWDQRKAEGRALGLAAHRSFVTYVAVVASAVRDEKGHLSIDEVWIVADAGAVVNLERVRSQLEGAVIFGMSLALYGEITMKEGATRQSNFRDYRLVRMAEAPRKIHIEVVQSDQPPGGVGEPGVPPVAPAITNALFALTGTRIRTLPAVHAVPV